jgi:hypothetical protein
MPEVNKTMNGVFLKDEVTGTIVKCHATRSLTQNRKLARRIMNEKLESLELGSDSKLSRRIQRKQKRKSKQRARANAKYQDVDAAGLSNMDDELALVQHDVSHQELADMLAPEGAVILSERQLHRDLSPAQLRSIQAQQPARPDDDDRFDEEASSSASDDDDDLTSSSSSSSDSDTDISSSSSDDDVEHHAPPVTRDPAEEEDFVPLPRTKEQQPPSNTRIVHRMPID